MKIHGLASREQKLKNSSLGLKRIFCNSFWLSKDTEFILPACSILFLFLRRIEWTINTLTYRYLKRSFWKFGLRSRSWPDRKRSCCISVDPYGRPEHIYGVFIALAGLYQKLLPKSAGDLSWPEMTLATWRWVTGRNIPTQDVKSTCNLMFESVSNGFLRKQAPFIFLPSTYYVGYTYKILFSSFSS